MRTTTFFICTAHPRVSGENRVPEGAPYGVNGSSPRERGKHFFSPNLVDNDGLIPA